MKRPNKKEMAVLVTKLMERLNPEDPNWIDEAQDRSDDKQLEAEKILLAAGYTAKDGDPDDADWDDLVQELAEELSWVPGHYQLTGVISRAGVRKGGKR